MLSMSAKPHARFELLIPNEVVELRDGIWNERGDAMTGGVWN